MTTRQTVLEKLNAYLNHQLSLVDLVDWAENTLIEPDTPEDEDADTLMDVLVYLGAADTRGFPLTWDIPNQFVERLGGWIHASVELV
jgi:hypothetical protein